MLNLLINITDHAIIVWFHNPKQNQMFFFFIKKTSYEFILQTFTAIANDIPSKPRRVPGITS